MKWKFSALLSLTLALAGCTSQKHGRISLNVHIPVTVIQQEQTTRQVESIATMGVFPDQPQKWGELETRKLDAIDDIYKRVPKEYQEKYGQYLPIVKVLATLLIGLYGGEIPALAGFAAMVGTESVAASKEKNEKTVRYEVDIRGVNSADMPAALKELKELLKGAHFAKDNSTL